jgi:hypothetical protein
MLISAQGQVLGGGTDALSSFRIDLKQAKYLSSSLSQVMVLSLLRRVE